MNLTVRRQIRKEQLKELHETVALLMRLGWKEWEARNVLWWRFHRGLSLVPRKAV